MKNKKTPKNLKNQRGQGVMEYLILTALVGIFCLVAVKQFGETIKVRVEKMKSKIVRHVKIRR